MKRNFLFCIAFAASIVASYTAFVLAPSEATMGDSYRVLYVHVPAAWTCYLAFSLSFIGSILFLRKKKHAYDTIAEVSAMLGLMYGALTLISGAIWANSVWGLYWNWDPRETTTLILWIAYVGYVAIRLSTNDTERRRYVGAVYNILAFSTVPLSYLSISLLPTLHPQILGAAGISITLPMLVALIINLAAATIFFYYLFATALEISHLEERVDALYYERGNSWGS
jgi:heme exporter protein C